MTAPHPPDFEKHCPITLCWECGRDMTFSAPHMAWTCECGFVLNEGFCQITHASFECIVFVDDHGLAKRRGQLSWQIIGTQRRWD